MIAFSGVVSISPRRPHASRSLVEPLTCAAVSRHSPYLIGQADVSNGRRILRLAWCMACRDGFATKPSNERVLLTTMTGEAPDLLVVGSDLCARPRATA